MNGSKKNFSVYVQDFLEPKKWSIWNEQMRRFVLIILTAVAIVTLHVKLEAHPLLVGVYHFTNFKNQWGLCKTQKW